MNLLAGIGKSIARNCSETQILSSRNCSAHCTGRFNAHEMKLWMSQLHCVLQLRVALVCVFLLCFAIQGCAGLRILIVFCTSGLRWSAYSYCALEFRLALVCVFLLCFATQGCAGLRILIVFSDSGLRWSAYSYCVLQFRVALVCVFLLCFAPQGCAGLRILIVFWNSGLQSSAYSNYVVVLSSTEYYWTSTL